MAKEIAIGKRAKISEAQEYMILAVLGASCFLGVALALVLHFIDQISFNTRVIMSQEQTIVAYSDVIKNTGICRSPSGSIYSDDELNRCDPEAIDTSEIPGTLRSNILEDVAANNALNSVPKEATSGCINQKTQKNYTYKELNDIYSEAYSAEEKTAASRLIKTCSALRIIPDALPAFKNEEALLASLNNIFIVSGLEPESLSPTGESVASESGTGLFVMSVGLMLETDSLSTITMLKNIERSIREFDIQTATIEWGGDDLLTLHAQATAYYMKKSAIEETTVVINPDESASSNNNATTEEE